MEGNKSIYVFEDSSFSSYGGGQVVTEVILNNLIAKGFDITLVDYCDSSVFQNRCQDLAVKRITLKHGLKRSKTSALLRRCPQFLKY